jgi:hypothetical protein
MNPRAAAAGSAAPVTAEATATRLKPSDSTAARRSSVMPPIANAGRLVSRATLRRNSAAAKASNDFVGDGKQGPTPR